MNFQPHQLWGYPLRIYYRNFVFPQYKQNVAFEVAKVFDDQIRTVLDVGCDDGDMALKIIELKPQLNISGVDIQSHRPAKIKRTIFNGTNLPFPDKSFDAVMAIDVFHHKPNHLEDLLLEMKRVSKQYIIIKDHPSDSKFSYFLLCLWDWLANEPFGIKCPFNFLSSNSWSKLFNQCGLIVDKKVTLNHKTYLNPKYHFVVRLKKSKK